MTAEASPHTFFARYLRLGAAILVVVLAGCGGSRPVSTAADLNAAGTGADAYAYLLAYTTYAPYRTGTDGAANVAAWIGTTLSSFGYQVSIEEYPFPRFVTQQAALAVGGFAPTAFPLYYSGSTGAAGVDGPLLDVGAGQQAIAGESGAVAYAQVPLTQGSAPTLDSVIATAGTAGAKALVVSFGGGPENEVVVPDVDFRTGLCGLPVLIVGKQDGQTLSSLSGSTAHFVLDAQLQDAVYRNVIATLPGSGSGTILVGTPSNGWFTAAGERGGGVGGLLTLARYFAARGPYSPTLKFIALGGHEVGYAGLRAYTQAHTDELPQIGAYVHLGASIATEAYTEANGLAQDAGKANGVGLYVSENPLLETLTLDAMLGDGVTTATPIPPSISDPGEQQYMYDAKVPISSISASGYWFHTPGDLPDDTSAALLDPVVQGFRDTIQGALDTGPAALLASNGIAAALAPQPAAAPACQVQLKSSQAGLIPAAAREDGQPTKDRPPPAPIRISVACLG